MLQVAAENTERLLNKLTDRQLRQRMPNILGASSFRSHIKLGQAYNLVTLVTEL